MSFPCPVAFTLLTPEKRTGREILDLTPEAYTPDELQESLADIRMVNRYLGDRRALLKQLSAKMGEVSEFSLLDIATGSADLPIAIADWARKAGLKASITGVDMNPRTVDLARKQTAGHAEITLEVADALRLRFPDKSFDFVLCSKTAHHFTEAENVHLIQEMRRIARRGYIVMDLQRSWIAYALIYLLTRLLARNRVTRNDGPLSVLRAFTQPELAALAEKAGSSRFTITREHFWLLVLSGDAG
ncbi:MAG: SAM-dependent methyltransferase [Geobacteraceae bacterium GWC2_58_44]|nr:MAG: SAM-dependent methyltransferase [Geobacteraceae bacterium GWC2_58_44]HBG05493.1 SAM-dependent methyltransferase [Geobacter sp.]